MFWEETNPLIRNVFIWDEQTLLKYPVKGLASTLEERQFAARFGILHISIKVLYTFSVKPPLN
ncbi:MAG: hypothetical protein U9N77_15965 [Thermodesulfobacteriota bacterium]|nr:hypothetical protein [Thermodesulfobacteriota bacterium]